MDKDLMDFYKVTGISSVQGMMDRINALTDIAVELAKIVEEEYGVSPFEVGPRLSSLPLVAHSRGIGWSEKQDERIRKELVDHMEGAKTSRQ